MAFYYRFIFDALQLCYGAIVVRLSVRLSVRMLRMYCG